MMDKQALLKYITEPDEKLLFSKSLDRLYLCDKKRERTFTDFLDPYRLEKFLSLFKKCGLNNVTFSEYGGTKGCERRIIGFSPDNMPIDPLGFPIDCVHISYNPKFSRELKHRDFLGSILSLGIDRSRVGDIILDGTPAADVFICSDISEYVITNLEKAGNTKVKSARKECGDIKNIQDNMREINITVTSLRLDGVISALFHMSRGKAVELINSEKAYVNWMLATDTSKKINENDVITLRGYGRGRIIKTLGNTKKGRRLVKCTEINFQPVNKVVKVEQRIKYGK